MKKIDTDLCAILKCPCLFFLLCVYVPKCIHTFNTYVLLLYCILYVVYPPIVGGKKKQRTIGPENAHLKPDLGVLSHNEMTLTLNTHTPLLTS